MDHIVGNIVMILLMNGSVAIIPGVNFFLVARQSVLNGAHSGLLCACGITLAVSLHALLAALSVRVLIQYPILFACIRYLGAGYLLYLGTTFIMRGIQYNKSDGRVHVSLQEGKRESFRSGFLVDLFNPFVSIFYLSMFSSMTMEANPVFELGCYLSTIFAINFVWFSMVAVFFHAPLIRNTLQKKSQYLQIVTGLAMYFFCARVVLGF